MDRKPGGLTWVGSPAGQYDVGATWTAEGQLAVLEDGRGIAEDEVHCAVNVTLAVELAESQGVECVLVPGDAAPVERGLV